MPKSITIGEILDKEHYVQVTGDEKALERPIYEGNKSTRI